jgi:hypothetical protein
MAGEDNSSHIVYIVLAISVLLFSAMAIGVFVYVHMKNKDKYEFENDLKILVEGIRALYDILRENRNMLQAMTSPKTGREQQQKKMLELEQCYYLERFGLRNSWNAFKGKHQSYIDSQRIRLEDYGLDRNLQDFVDAILRLPCPMIGDESIDQLSRVQSICDMITMIYNQYGTFDILRHLDSSANGIDAASRELARRELFIRCYEINLIAFFEEYSLRYGIDEPYLEMRLAKLQYALVKEITAFMRNRPNYLIPSDACKILVETIVRKFRMYQITPVKVRETTQAVINTLYYAGNVLADLRAYYANFSYQQTKWLEIHLYRHFGFSQSDLTKLQNDAAIVTIQPVRETFIEDIPGMSWMGSFSLDMYPASLPEPPQLYPDMNLFDNIYGTTEDQVESEDP